MPELTVVAGANGAGKSTLTKLSSINIPLIDPDAIAREIAPEQPESAALAAGRKAIELARSYIQSNCSFVVETTLEPTRSIGRNHRLEYLADKNKPDFLK
jgi:predicted ABC-type ATPase